MRELERLSEPSAMRAPTERVAIVGAGRLGTALALSLRGAGIEVDGPLRRGADAGGTAPVLLCVPDGEIAAAAAALAGGGAVGHCSGATGLRVLGDREAFSLHPLMTVRNGAGPGVFAGAGAAIDGSTPRALAIARTLAELLGMRTIHVDERDRPAYHAAACIASNFLVTLEAAAERLAATTGLERDLLVPLVRATVENWAALGPECALTGPAARGDELTITRQRDAVGERAPELLELFEVLTTATRRLAATAAAPR